MFMLTTDNQRLKKYAAVDSETPIVDSHLPIEFTSARQIISNKGMFSNRQESTNRVKVKINNKEVKIVKNPSQKSLGRYNM